jgi:uncharacterized phiE125 gp8 family phage protein
MSVTEVLYLDEQGQLQTYGMENFYVDHRGIPGSLILKEGASPPQPGVPVNGIEIQFQAGYGAQSSSIPAPLRQAIKLVAGRFHGRMSPATMRTCARCAALRQRDFADCLRM